MFRVMLGFAGKGRVSRVGFFGVVAVLIECLLRGI